jgi:hypothetical protein
MTTTITLRARPDRRNLPAREQLLRRVRAEFDEMPCLRLTRGQAQRLFGLAPGVCDRVLASLVTDGMLRCGPDGRYALHASGVRPPLRRRAADQPFSAQTS